MLNESLQKLQSGSFTKEEILKNLIDATTVTSRTY